MIDGHVADIPKGDAVASTIAQLLGLAEGSAAPSETAWAIRQLLAIGAGEHPLVVVVDDIHWAEATLLDMLADLPAVAAAPILVICLSRPGVARPPPGVASYGPAWNRSARRTSVHSSRACSARCSPRANPYRARFGGQPAVRRRAVAMLLDEGVLRLEDGTCKLEGDLDTFALPVSLAPCSAPVSIDSSPRRCRTRARRDRR